MEEGFKQIYLIGFMGAGKSAVAKAYAHLYQLTQLEMDAYIEQEEGRRISQIFEEEGEEAFRAMETRLLCYLSGGDSLIVSCGGGVAMREENVELMRKNGVVVYLQAQPETILSRVKDTHTRPLLEGNMNLEYIRTLMEARREKYEGAADLMIVVDEKSVYDICQEIHERIGELAKGAVRKEGEQEGR